jgi:hypothetical protein
MKNLLVWTFALSLPTIPACGQPSRAEPTAASPKDGRSLEPWASVDESFKGCQGS